MALATDAGTSPVLPLANANFEFGKRKRWADLVITQLVDVLTLVLSPQCKILYCGNGLKSLLGWQDTDLIDYAFDDLLNAEDKEGFICAFEDSLRTGSLLPPSIVRIKCAASASNTTDGEKVFELNGRAQLVDAEDSADSPMQVFFAVAKPHPNKSLDTLNTYIDLQEEHERLQQRVAELRARAPRSAPSSPASSAGASSQGSMYATTSMVPKRLVHHSHPHSPQGTYSNPPADDISSSPASSGQAETAGTSGRVVDEDEELSRKKKIPKKSLPGAEQYVCITCGRTDSPEWRKGPLGPKTLCNACGLRWAKQAKVQKLSEEASAAAQQHS